MNLDTYTSYTYDSSKHLEGIQRGGSGVEKADYEYEDSDGTLTKATYGNAAYSEYAYYASGALSKVSHFDSGESLIQSMEYQYEKAGNVTKIERDDELTYTGKCTIAYEYDDVGRLTLEDVDPAEGSSQAWGTTQYWYDAAGNRTKHTDTNPWYPYGRTQVYEYSPRSELTKHWDPYPSGYWTLQYDYRGNLTKRAHSSYPSSWFTYEWDSSNRLTKVYHNAAGKTTYYKYDAFGRRAAKKVNSGDWKWYFYDGLKVIAEGTDTDDRKFYTLAPGAIGGIITRDDGTTKYTYMYDRLGNVIALTDDAGDLACVYHTSAFGHWAAYGSSGFNQTISDPQPYHLTTKEYDTDTGLYYFNARWYDRHTGRFVSREETRGDGPNLYHFNYANPIGRADINGKTSLFVDPFVIHIEIEWPIDLPTGYHVLHATHWICQRYCADTHEGKPLLGCVFISVRRRIGPFVFHGVCRCYYCDISSGVTRNNTIVPPIIPPIPVLPPYPRRPPHDPVEDCLEVCGPNPYCASRCNVGTL